VSTFGRRNLSNPVGIAFDSSGNLYAANSNTSTISKFDSSGSFVSTFGGSNLSNPAGLAFDSSGNLYAANYFGNNIAKYDSSGSFLFSFNTPSGLSPSFLAINGNPPAVPEPGAVAFGIIAAGSVLGLVARKRRS
jgi:DNA-binding beta-propeller fold protein YncE